MSPDERAAGERVRRLLPPGCRFVDVRWLTETDSTNRVAAECARGGSGEGVVVVADFQSAGRGRLDRRWEAPAGSALLLSVVLRPIDLPVERRHLAVAAVGLATRAACYAIGSPFPDLKWPNDLLVGERKLAGVLAEAVDDAVVVGIGCNVSAAPVGAVCLEEVVGRPIDRVDLAAGLLGSLDGILGRWDEVATAYRRACTTVGRRVRVETATTALEGDAVSIDESGRLVVRFADGVRAVSAGDVIHVRPGGAARSWKEAGSWEEAEGLDGPGHRRS